MIHRGLRVQMGRLQPADMVLSALRGGNRMREENEEVEERTRKKRKHKKKKGFGHYLYAFVVLVLTIANISLALLLLTYVQDISVSGTKYSEEGEIVEWIQEDPLTRNSLYTLWKFNSGSYDDMPAYLDDVSVSLGAPWKVKVKVQEKEIMGCILSDGTYMYIDKEGLVLKESAESMERIPVIEGLAVGEVSLFEKIEVEDEKIFSYIANISDEIQQNELSPDRIVWEEDSMNLYFGDICVQLGKSNFDEKLVQVAPILEQLEGKSGTLHLEHYNSLSSKISFVDNTAEAETENLENMEETE